MDTLILDSALVPIIVALVQVLKPFINDERLYPVLSIMLGILLEFAVAGSYDVMSATVGTLVIKGLLVGLAAAGLYSGGKTVGKSQA